MAYNTWQDRLFESDEVVTRESYFLGGGAAVEWSLGELGIWGLEASLIRHLNDQNN